MTTYDRLLAEVIAVPGEDAPRLILADWLEENGQEARGEFIRVQCDLVRLRGINQQHDQLDSWCTNQDCRYCNLRRREGDLLERWVEYWIPKELGYTTGVASAPDSQRRVYLGPDSWYVFRRGFVAEITCTLAAWCGEQCWNCLSQGSVLSDLNPGFSGRTVCENCHGTGVTGRHGPALVRAAPLERVTLLDREPGDNLRGGFFWRTNPDGDQDRHDLPRPLFGLLAGGEVTFQVRTYPARQAALDALSAALLLWASSVG